MEFNNDVQTQVMYLLFFIIALFIIKPSIFFSANGKARQFGVGVDSEGYKKTLYTVHIAIIVVVALVIALV